MFKHILVPLDSGDTNEATVKRACSFAREAGARITFYHAKVYFFPYLAREDWMIDQSAQQGYNESLNSRAQGILNGAQAVARDFGVDNEAFATDCNLPYEGIIAAATDKNCDLIFMSSHGRSGMAALLLGSETQKVLTHCKIPVLVYR